MPRIRMVIEYDGSRYHGFQIQANAHTIQAEIEAALYRLTGEHINLAAAGRTDSGVHAAGQVIAFTSNATIPPEKWRPALNSFLPTDIRVLTSERAGDDFHPRFDARSKSYAYLIYRQRQGAAFMRNYAWCSQQELNLAAMEKACGYLVGNHNFKSFCASGSAVKSFERQVKSCVLHYREPYLNLEINADGFLYNMVRIIVGTLINVGRGKTPASSISDIIAQKDRTLAGDCVPPNGLLLKEVYY